jgi:transcriptional regulator with XRE-family HTH domain
MAAGRGIGTPEMGKRAPRELPVVSRNVKRFREEVGLTQEALADRAGLSSVKMIESGKNVGRVKTLLAIANALRVDIGDLLADPDAAEPPELQRFLSSPDAASFDPPISSEERALLKRVTSPGRSASPETYYWEIKKLRSMKLDWDRKDKPTPAKASPGTATRRRRLGGGSGSVM